MTLDLSFTKDPEWITRREQQWENIKQRYSSDLTRKQRDICKQYYLTGVPPKSYADIYLEYYILLFPLQTKEGLEYCFKYNVRADHENLNSVLNLLWRRYLEASDELDYQTSLQMFDLFWGNRFDPIRKFPFLIANETTYRTLQIKSEDLLYMLTGLLNGWLKYPSDDTQDSIEVIKINYFFSLLPHIPKYILSLNPIVERDSMTHDERDGISVRNALVALLKAASTKFIRDQESKDRFKKITFLKNLANRFDDLKFPEYPQELINHWHWVKRRKVVFKIDFETSLDEFECYENIFEGFTACHDSSSGNLKRFRTEVKNRNPQALELLDEILRVWGVDERFCVESYNCTEDCDFFIVFSSVDVQFRQAIESMFTLCNVRNLRVTDLTPED